MEEEWNEDMFGGSNTIICFSVKFKAEFGESVFLIGETGEFGSWDPKKALKLNWKEGDVWETVTISKSPEFQYKYFISDTQGSFSNLNWEGGENRLFSKQKLLQESQQLEESDLQYNQSDVWKGE